MRTATKYSLVVLMTVIMCTTNALPEETDGKITPALPTQPGTQKPVDQHFLEIVMWLDGGMTYTNGDFTSPRLCQNKHSIDWSKMNISFNFSVLVTMNNEGVLRCPNSNSKCEHGILYFCIQKQIPDSKKFLDFYCCHINEKADCATTTCNKKFNYPLDMDKLDSCMNSPCMEKQYADVWSGEGKKQFPSGTGFPAFVVNGEYDDNTTNLMYTDFYGTTCKMYAKKLEPHYCPKE